MSPVPMPARNAPESDAATRAATSHRIPLWVDLRHVAINKRLPFFAAIRETGAEHVLFAKGDDHLQREGLSTYAIDGKGRLRDGKAAVGRLMVVQDAKQQAKAAKEDGIIVVEEGKGRILPIENLIAARQDRAGTLFARATTPQEAALCATILERGVHGILLAPATATDIVAADALLRQHGGKANGSGVKAEGRPAADVVVSVVGLASDGGGREEHVAGPNTLREATVTLVTDAGPGDRVCVDTTSILEEGEGLLVGSCAHSLALVLAETAANPVVNARPFRINAGAVHSYCLVPGGKTAYLAELAAGSVVLVVGPRGSRDVTVGRIKVENRPHRIVHWQTSRGPASIALQLAETVRLAGAPQAIAVTDIKSGMTILVHAAAAVARHTGVAVDESVEER